MSYAGDDLGPEARRSSAVLHGMLLFPVVVCAALYAYYFVAQAVVNPMPVEGVLMSASCRSSGISRQGTQTDIPTVLVVYEFPSRSTVRSPATSRHAYGRDDITEFIDYDTNANCMAAASALVPGSKRTVWAGENDMSDRFRARLTAERQYPSAALLWGPGCFAALVLWVRSRLTPIRRRRPHFG